MGRPPEQLLIAELQLILAEKRTYFALVRTGLAVVTMPLSIILFLIATANYHKMFHHPWVAFGVIGSLFIISLSGLSIYFKAHRKLLKLNGYEDEIRHRNKRIAEILI